MVDPNIGIFYENRILRYPAICPNTPLFSYETAIYSAYTEGLRFV